MTFGHEEQLGALWRDGLGLADAAERAGLDAPVASCPGWRVADLLWHTGEVHTFWRTVVAERWQDPSAYVEPDRPDDDALLGWYRDSVQQTVALFTGADPHDHAWSWAPGGGTVAWIVRRMAQETAVHRWDAERAASPGSPRAIDADVAVDGVDEFFEHFTPAADDAAEPVGGTVHLHCTDAPPSSSGGEWLVTELDQATPLEVRREHAKGDCAVRGTASDLLLLLWRRVDLDDPGRFEVFGDSGVARRLVARQNLE
jgi:uncharacterized protein (TIGR03083 family)